MKPLKSSKSRRIVSETADHITKVEQQYSEGLITLSEALTSIDAKIISKEIVIFKYYYSEETEKLSSPEQARLWLCCEERRLSYLAAIEITILPKPTSAGEETNES